MYFRKRKGFHMSDILLNVDCLDWYSKECCNNKYEAI